MHIFISLLGWLGMACVVGSFVLTGEKKIRSLNSIGCALQIVFFILQGFFMSWHYVKTNAPVVTLNALVLIMNIYHLFIKKKK